MPDWDGMPPTSISGHSGLDHRIGPICATSIQVRVQMTAKAMHVEYLPALWAQLYRDDTLGAIKEYCTELEDRQEHRDTCERIDLHYSRVAVE